MSIYWSEKIKKIRPYVPGEQPKDKVFIKLNTNENPYGPSPKAIKAMKNLLNDSLRLYPDPEGKSLKKAIARELDVNEDEVFVGNGSDEILAFCFQAFFEKDREILFPDITYSFYKVYAEFFNIPFNEVMLDEDFKVDIEGFLGKEVRGIILTNPNAPTGMLIGLDEIEKIVSKNPQAVVIIDEAYIDFGGQSAVKLIDKYKNILIVQTFSKSRSLAGLRVGFAIGNKDLIKGLDIVKNCFNSYTLDRVALEGAKLAIEDKKYFQNNIEKIIQTRERVKAELLNRGFIVTDSKSNFLFVKHPSRKAKDIFEYLKSNCVLVRYFDIDRIKDFLRISIGKDYEMDKLLELIDKEGVQYE